jgi:3-hydroxyisobutyrate dehydrogenase
VTAKSDVVLTCVTDSPDVQRVYLGKGGILEAIRSGMIAIDMSTISPAVAREVATALETKGARLLDAPVSGGERGAIEATLSIMVGGDAEALAEVTPILEALGKRIIHIGPNGMGQTVKLCNQIVGALNDLAMCEGLILAAKAGADVSKMVDAVSAGAAGSWAMSNLAPKVLKRDFSPGFMVKLQQKDLRLVLETAKELKISLPGTALVNQLFQSVEGRGGGDEGIQALVKSLEHLDDVKVNG